ncbi:MAG: histidinol dehydrogenase [Candidatus Hodgkinia cicadicola]
MYLTTPNTELMTHFLSIACAIMCGIRLIYLFSEVQAIAVMSMGTLSVWGVDKIVGPGNVFVMVAKRLASKAIDIDWVTVPSELIILTDRSDN